MGPSAVAILLFGGKGSRIGSDKQFLAYEGRSLLQRDLEALGSAKGISACLLVARRGKKKATEEALGHPPLPVLGVCLGGPSREESVLRALEELHKRGYPDETIVLVHDGARPFVEKRTLEACRLALESHEAAIVAFPCRDSMVRAKGDEIVYERREELQVVQTPQGFRLGVGLKAFRRAKEKGTLPSFTDDGSVLQSEGVRLCLVLGSPGNKKITYPEDLPSEGKEER